MSFCLLNARHFPTTSSGGGGGRSQQRNYMGPGKDFCITSISTMALRAEIISATCRNVWSHTTGKRFQILEFTATLLVKVQLFPGW
jgi:hypothetical protein